MLDEIEDIGIAEKVEYKSSDKLDSGAAMRRNKSEPAQKSTVYIVVTVEANVDKILPLKYFEMSKAQVHLDESILHTL